MRSSKSRSRSKSNRQRSMGNIVNRVFDSSGPEGKVRGTPQQIIEKYVQLARDAALGNDRVAAENFQQHAEHYTRMLGEAQREQEARREQQEQQEQQARDRQRDRRDNNNGNNGNSNNGQGGQQNRPYSEPDSLQAVEPGRGRPDVYEDETYSAPQPDLVIDVPAKNAAADDGTAPEGDSGLVETPESAAKPRNRARNRKPKPEGTDGAEQAPSEVAPKPRRPRAKKPDAEAAASPASPADHPKDPTEIAE